jgi:hypothetical protein
MSANIVGTAAVKVLTDGRCCRKLIQVNGTPGTRGSGGCSSRLPSCSGGRVHDGFQVLTFGLYEIVLNYNRL